MFANYEDEIRQQLTDMFGPYGFDAQRDIAANFNCRISACSTAAAWFYYASGPYFLTQA